MAVYHLQAKVIFGPDKFIWKTIKNDTQTRPLEFKTAEEAQAYFDKTYTRHKRDNFQIIEYKEEPKK